MDNNNNNIIAPLVVGITDTDRTAGIKTILTADGYDTQEIDDMIVMSREAANRMCQDLGIDTTNIKIIKGRK